MTTTKQSKTEEWMEPKVAHVISQVGISHV